MVSRDPVIVVVVAVALVMALKLTGLFGIFLLAILGATITEGLRTGLVVPHSLGISRVRTPIKFWLIIGICAALLVVNILGLFLWH